jgi:hypothetical protein
MYKFKVSKKNLKEKLNLKSIYTCYGFKLYESLVMEDTYKEIFYNSSKDQIIKLNLGQEGYTTVLTQLEHKIKGKRIFGGTDRINTTTVESYSSLEALMNIAKIKDPLTRNRLGFFMQNETFENVKPLLNKGYQLIPEEIFIQSETFKNEAELFSILDLKKCYSCKTLNFKDLEVSDLKIKKIDFKNNWKEELPTLKIKFIFEGFSSCLMEIKKEGNLYNFKTKGIDQYFSSIEDLKAIKLEELRKESSQWEKLSITKNKEMKVLF